MRRHANDMIPHELRTFARAVLRMLQRTFPFNNRPTVKVIRRHLGKDSAKIDLTVPKRPEAASTLDPRLIAAVDALTPRRIELGVLDVEHADHVLIDVDVVQTI